jgi:hypothetical protein
MATFTAEQERQRRSEVLRRYPEGAGISQDDYEWATMTGEHAGNAEVAAWIEVTHWCCPGGCGHYVGEADKPGHRRCPDCGAQGEAVRTDMLPVADLYTSVQTYGDFSF